MSSLFTSDLLRTNRRRRTERRKDRRLPPTPVALCRLLIPGRVAPALAWILDLSPEGALLRLDGPCLVGVALPAFLVNAPHSYGVEVELHVTRCESDNNGSFCIGARFSRRLSAEQLAFFLV